MTGFIIEIHCDMFLDFSSVPLPKNYVDTIDLTYNFVKSALSVDVIAVLILTVEYVD